ncbi:MAG: hypothetical protein ACXAD7_22070 [Candidatus Kariarchaeaceae archaeon]
MISTDSQNNVYLTSATSSIDFPTTENSYQKNSNGGIDRTLSKFDLSGQLIWSTYFGGSEDDHQVNRDKVSTGFLSLAIDHNDRIFIGSDKVSSDFAVTTQIKYDENIMGGLSIFTSSGDLTWSS